MSLKEKWNTLLSQSNLDTVFLRHEWFSVWWQSFGEHKKLFILLITENGRLVGIAPLMQSKESFRGFRVNCIRFIENEESPRIDFVINRNKLYVVPFIFQYLTDNLDGWDIIILKNILADSDTFKIVSGKLRTNNFSLRIKDSLQSPVLYPDMDWNTFLSKQSKLFRKNIRRYRNKIQKLGNITLQKITTCSNSSKTLALIAQVGKKSWKHQSNKDISSTGERWKFFSLLTEVASRESWLNLWLLLIDDKPVAFEYHLEYKNTIHGMRSEFDEEYGSYSPGFVLDNHIVKNVFDHGNLQYDMGGVDDSYKLRWTTKVQQHKEVFLFNRQIYSRFLYIIEFIIINRLSRTRLFRSVRKLFKN